MRNDIRIHPQDPTFKLFHHLYQLSTFASQFASLQPIALGNGHVRFVTVLPNCGNKSSSGMNYRARSKVCYKNVAPQPKRGQLCFALLTLVRRTQLACVCVSMLECGFSGHRQNTYANYLNTHTYTRTLHLQKKHLVLAHTWLTLRHLTSFCYPLAVRDGRKDERVRHIHTSCWHSLFYLIKNSHFC